MEEIKNKFVVGDTVRVGKHLEGTIQRISLQESPDGNYPVYHVTLMVGGTRHFTEDQIKKVNKE